MIGEWADPVGCKRKVREFDAGIIPLNYRRNGSRLSKGCWFGWYYRVPVINIVWNSRGSLCSKAYLPIRLCLVCGCKVKKKNSNNLILKQSDPMYWE